MTGSANGSGPPEPPGPSRAAALIVGISFQRWINRWTSGGWRAAQPIGPATDVRRRAISGDRQVGLMFLAIVGAAMFGFGVMSQMTSIPGRLVADDAASVGQIAARCIKWADDNPTRGTAPSKWLAQRDDYLLGCFKRDFAARGIQADEWPAKRALERYNAFDGSAFHEVPTYTSLWSESWELRRWPGVGGAGPIFLALAALVVLGLAMTVVGSADARHLEDELSWLYQTPAKVSTLLGARALIQTVLQPPAWIVAAPMFFVIARMHGRGTSAYVLGA